MAFASPYLTQTTAGVGLNATLEVSVMIDGNRCRWVKVTPSQNADPGEAHEVAFNEIGAHYQKSTATTAAVEHTVLGNVPERGPHMLGKVFITSGKAATTFTVESSL